MTADPDPAATGRSAYSPVGPEALERLGLDVHAPLSSLRPAYRRLLPEAVPGGYFAALSGAVSRGEVAPGDPEDQLRWLADRLRLLAPEKDDLSVTWGRAWKQAVAAVGEPAPRELGPRARRALLDELLRLPRYRQRLADALTRALRIELNRR